jgi:hypothetical protein
MQKMCLDTYVILRAVIVCAIKFDASNVKSKQCLNLIFC